MASGDVITDADEVRAKIEAAVQRTLDDFEAHGTTAPASATLTQERHTVAHYPPRSETPAGGDDAQRGDGAEPVAAR